MPGVGKLDVENGFAFEKHLNGKKMNSGQHGLKN
jgi:hypothetical protein